MNKLIWNVTKCQEGAEGPGSLHKRGGFGGSALCIPVPVWDNTAYPVHKYSEQNPIPTWWEGRWVLSPTDSAMQRKSGGGGEQLPLHSSQLKTHREKNSTDMEYIVKNKAFRVNAGFIQKGFTFKKSLPRNVVAMATREGIKGQPGLCGSERKGRLCLSPPKSGCFIFFYLFYT